MNSNRLKERVITYKGKDIIVYFSVDRCTHVAECLRGAPMVFDSERRPWVEPDAEPPDKVAEVVMRCPTGALHFQRTDGGAQESIPEENVVILNADGPIYVHGDVELLSNRGELLLKDTRISLCRCGTSQHKPFCDGLHAINDFFDSGEISSKDNISFKSEIDSTTLRIKLVSNGPLILSGPFMIWDAAKRSSYKGTRTSLCRCGASKNRPFCDGSHTQIGFTTE